MWPTYRGYPLIYRWLNSLQKTFHEIDKIEVTIMKKGKIVFMAMCLWAGFALYSPARAALEFGLDCNGDGSIDESCYLDMEEILVADIYVSNVPEPGLLSANFRLDYDSETLELMESDTNVFVDFTSFQEMIDALNAGDETWKNNDVWDQGNYVYDNPGEITMGLMQNSEHFSGNWIKLATVSFIRINPGPVDLTIFTRDDPDNEHDDFVLEDQTVLDDDLDGGLHVAEITDENPDFDDDGDVDGRDVVAMIDYMENCINDCFSLEYFAGYFGREDALQY